MADRADLITLEHGSGGLLSRELVEELIYPFFKGSLYPALTDATPFDLAGGACITTDTYTVEPPFFPGGDIGRLSVFGTCNDLAVCGGIPRFLTVGLVLEEGLPKVTLGRVLESIASAAREAGVSILTGDTKVVPSGKGGGIYINTTGVGERAARMSLGPAFVEAGDRVLVTGPIGPHGIAVMAAREGLPVGESIRSDCALLLPLCRLLLDFGSDTRVMRDATRGGVAAVLNELSAGSRFGIEIDEASLPIDEEVAVVSELLGLNPLEIANEGLFVAFVSERIADEALHAARSIPLGRKAALVGRACTEHAGRVVLTTTSGGRRALDFPRGLLLPRIC